MEHLRNGAELRMAVAVTGTLNAVSELLQQLHVSF